MAAERMSRPINRALVVVAAVALVACDAPTYPAEEFAYDPTLLSNGLVYRWTAGRTIAVYVDPTSAPTGFDLASAVATGASQWNDVTRFADYRLAVTTRLADADVVVH